MQTEFSDCGIDRCKDKCGAANVPTEDYVYTSFCFLKRPEDLMKFIVASTIARFVTKVKSGWPYSNKLHSSFEKRRIRSVLVKLETWSRSFLRCVVKWGQCRR